MPRKMRVSSSWEGRPWLPRIPNDGDTFRASGEHVIHRKEDNTKRIHVSFRVISRPLLPRLYLQSSIQLVPTSRAILTSGLRCLVTSEGSTVARLDVTMQNLPFNKSIRQLGITTQFPKRRPAHLPSDRTTTWLHSP